MTGIVDAWAAERAEAEALFGLRPRRAADDGRAPSEVLVLRDEVGVAAVLALADAEAWQLQQETSRAHLVLASRRWVTLTDDEVTHVVDHLGGAHSLRIEGPGAAGQARRLRERLPCHQEDELLAMVLGQEEPDAVECIRVASKLAALRPAELDGRHLAALDRLLGHPSTAVRRAGIRSAYGCRWKALLAVVEQRVAQEQHLVAQLEALRRHVAGEGVAR
jgi:hypothetical protein